MIRTRIAPSPTGALHIGTARTALFNYLYAKQHDGEFLLRIEDTDQARSTKDFEKDIIDSLTWLGISWNGDLVRQSERNSVYKKYIDELKEKGLAYEEPAREGEGTAIILKKPEGDISYSDIIRGDILFAADELKDLVIQKPDGTPTYNFAVAVDDHEMGISHVIRGEDHISNTPKQLMVYRALKWDVPFFAHLPLIMAPDRSKLSKRHGAQSIIEFRDLGYLPEAVINFMALLGWHPKDEKELFSLSELIEVFKLEDVQKGGAIFDVAKFGWINQQHIQILSKEEYKKRLENYLGQSVSDALAELTQQRVSTLKEAELELKWLQKPDYKSNLLLWKDSTKANALNNLNLAAEVLADLEDYSAKNIETIIMPLADERGRGAFLWPLRVALSGADKSPGPFELAALLGKEKTLQRVRDAIHKLNAE